MKLKLLIIFTTAIFFSCTEPEKVQLPVSDEKLVETLSDLYLFQSRLDYEIPADTALKITKNDIFKKHDMNPVLFDSTMKLLSAHPNQMKEIQAKVEEKLQDIQRKLITSSTQK